METNTAPVFPANNNHFGGISSSSGISGSRSSSNPVATANIINQQADASRSLYQICVALRQRLAQVPGFEPYLENLDQQSGDDDGPVESLWNLLRAGHPLLAIYNNSLQPNDPLAVAPSPNEAKRTKLAIFKFVEACMRDLQIPATQLFVVADLTGNDTTGLVKQRGLLQQTTPYPDDTNLVIPGAKMSTRDYILREMVNTERKYVQDLENLHDLKKTLEQKGAIPGDVVHQIFLNINAILDFQRRFLIRVETTNSLPPASQLWGNPFVTFEEAFNIYQPFIANQSKAAALAKQVFDKIQQTAHPVACDFNTLDGFLLKPMQRLVKYPLLLKHQDLLKDVTKNSDDESAKADLTAGIASAERILKKANDAVERNVLDEALEELIGRVDDWKNHKVEQFGRLLQHGVYTVITGRSDQEKDYEIYLFEFILLCCKEINPNKEKSSKKDKTKSNTPKPRNKNNKLQLKGRIFMTNVTEVISFAKPGSYTVQIWWKGDPGVENFVIKFTNEEMMRKWATRLDNQRKENTPQQTVSPDQPTPDFTWMRNVNNIENPYAQQDEDDEDDDELPPGQGAAGNMGFGSSSAGGIMNRNASSTSLRARVPQPLNLNGQQPVSPPLGTSSQSNPLSSPDLPIPTQLKVKIVCDKGNYVTLVVAFNITYQSLIDRIDAKLARFTNSSIGKGNLRLRYRDEDGDLVTIESDDDIQIAFLEWREGLRNMYSGGVGEIELFCVGEM
ncbi:putative cdc24 protein [Eutypa lata UCREL1]|uniref:Putative cdc24 protein n=1 Tax=Eutypa lata (strain UCR-EL1) TaxID=1287681 RepID=M7SFW8_EUTLA|nr:putative cdc24 protein [Eutypa lata UCREL1]